MRLALPASDVAAAPNRMQTMARLKRDPTRERNLTHDYAKWLLLERRERTAANGKLFARQHTTRGRRFHGYNEEEVCTIIGVDFYGAS